MTVILTHSPDVFVRGAFHQLGEVLQFFKLARLVVQAPHLLGVLQRVVHIFQIVVGLRIIACHLLHDACESGSLATKGMVEVVGIQLSVEFIDRTYQRAHGAGLSALHGAQARIVDAVVQTGHLFPIPTILVGSLTAGSRMSAEDDEALCAGCCGVDVAVVCGQFPDGAASPTAHDFVIGNHAEVLVVGHALPHRVVIVALAHHSHLDRIARNLPCEHVHQQLRLVNLRAVVGTSKEEMTVILTVGTQRDGVLGCENLRKLTLSIQLQDVLLSVRIGAIGAEIDVVAIGDSHAVIDARLASIDHTEVARLTVVLNDVGTLVGVVAGNVAIIYGINELPEVVKTHAAGSKIRSIQIDQRTCNIACRSNVDVVATHRHTPCIAVFTVTARHQTVHLSLCSVRIRYPLHRVPIISMSVHRAAKRDGSNHQKVLYHNQYFLSVAY